MKQLLMGIACMPMAVGTAVCLTRAYGFLPVPMRLLKMCAMSRIFLVNWDTAMSGIAAEWVRLSAFASVGDWRWKNDVEAVIYDNYSDNQVGTVGVYSDGLPVGGAPQTQVGAAAHFDIPAGFSVDMDWAFNDRMYAEFDPVTRTSADDRTPAYRIPAYHLLGATLQWSGTISGTGNPSCRLTVFLTGANLLDTMYIERGKDGAKHDLSTFAGYWGFGRNFSLGLRVAF
jgi:hypothetical protein